MTLTPSMKAIEEIHERPLRDILIDLYDKHRNWERVASSLTQSRFAIFQWRIRVGLDEVAIEVIIRQRDAERQQNEGA